jgi:hypothetical protein
LNGSYLYTAYETEKVDIETKYSDFFVLEGTAWRAQKSPTAGFVPLHRFRNLTNGTYLNTAFESEKNDIIAQYSQVFEYEGPAYHVLPTNPQTAGEATTLVATYLAAVDAQILTAIPVTGAAAFGDLVDPCYLNNGSSKSLATADYDANPLTVSSRQFEIGSTRTGMTILADRELANSDNSWRRELDIKYVINYLDGTKTEDARQTLIVGSSSGTKTANGSICATSLQSAAPRALGNRRIASVGLSASNARTERVSLSAGSIKTPAITYSKNIAINVRDPANIITYATISGPGLMVGGSPASFKLVSPRVLRDAPEFLGKNGHYLDLIDTDTFRVCRVGPSSPLPGGTFESAEAADCVVGGATTNAWGSLGVSQPSTNDLNFDSLGVVAGGIYTVKLYAGDGWKTVNGQAGVTPVATYASTLANLPMSTVVLAGTSAALVYPAVSATNKFHIPDSATVLPWQQAQALRTKVALSVPMQWTAPGAMPDGRALGASGFYSFVNGSTAEVSLYATSRQTKSTAIASTATSGTLDIPVPLAPLATVYYGQIAVDYSNRNGNTISAIRTFD